VAKGDEEKLDLLIANRWGGEVEAATRVEFQVPREELRERFQIETVDDLLAKGGAMLEWLTLEWFRLTDGLPDRDNGHEARAVLHPLWERVRAAFVAWIGAPAGPVEVRPWKRPSAKRLWQGLLGCLTSIAAVTGREFETVGDLAKWAVDELGERIGQEDFAKWWFKQADYLAGGTGRGLASDVPF
jgi:hypothetical protein